VYAKEAGGMVKELVLSAGDVTTFTGPVRCKTLTVTLTNDLDGTVYA
jgi:hypothetical protein